MGDQFIGQINVFPFDFAPSGWALCNGQIMGIQQNQALFSLIGTYYGGNGVQTFALPNLQGCFAVGQSQGYVIGERGGQVNHTLLLSELPLHTHTMLAAGNRGQSATPVNTYPAGYSAALYSGSANTTLGSGSSLNAGGQSHNNMPPYLVMSICISLTGIFPSRG